MRIRAAYSIFFRSESFERNANPFRGIKTKLFCSCLYFFYETMKLSTLCLLLQKLSKIQIKWASCFRLRLPLKGSSSVWPGQSTAFLTLIITFIITLRKLTIFYNIKIFYPNYNILFMVPFVLICSNISA